MKYFLLVCTLFSLVFSSSSDILLAQEKPGIFTSTETYKGNNTSDPDDISGLNTIRETTAEENSLIDEIRKLREKDDRSLLNGILQLEDQLEALNPNSVSRRTEYNGRTIIPAQDINPALFPKLIGNVEIRNSGTALVTAIATATEQRGTTEGRIWLAFSLNRPSVADTIWVYYSDTGGLSWIPYAVGPMGGTDQINHDQLDMEIIEGSSGEKYIWITFGYRLEAAAGRWSSAGLILQSPTWGASWFGLTWPGDDASKRYYRPRITSDNAVYSNNAYLYMVVSFDSTRINTQKTLRCINPYTVTPTFQYKADKLYWYSSNTTVQRDLHSDIAYFRNGSDSIIVSFSNVPDSTRLFFAKSNISNGPGTSTGAGGAIGGSEPSDHKQFARLSSNGNDNGSIICVFGQNTNSIWKIKYFRTINFGNFYGTYESTLQGSPTSDSYQPEIVGVRNMNKHYFAWRVDGDPDSLRYIGVTSSGNWPQNVFMMNEQTQTGLSGWQGPKPGFRYVDSDSCFVVYPLIGPYDIWAAFGCQEGTAGSVTVTSPNGGETWVVGSSQNIGWTSTDVINVRIELSINNGATWSDIVASTPSTGIYLWTVPNSPSAQCRIRISELGNPAVSDISDDVFTIDYTPGVEDEMEGIPDTYTLFQNFPNPFNPVTSIYYGLPEESSVTIVIYDVLGTEVLKIREDQKPAGYHKLSFDGSSLNSGVYFYKLEVDNFSQVRKMILMK